MKNQNTNYNGYQGHNSNNFSSRPQTSKYGANQEGYSQRKYPSDQQSSFQKGQFNPERKGYNFNQK
jgi:hypothetical protein